MQRPSSPTSGAERLPQSALSPYPQLRCVGAEDSGPVSYRPEPGRVDADAAHLPDWGADYTLSERGLAANVAMGTRKQRR